MDTKFKAYRRARWDFLTAQSLGYAVSTYRLPGLFGRHGETLACDVAAKKTPGNRHAIITTSGVHGIEAYAGSGLQRHWMREMDVPLGVDVIHVHALNPFGYAYGHRGDEKNIDVNRNFVSRFPGVEFNPGYSELADVIVPQKMGIGNLPSVLNAIRKYGMGQLQTVLQKGQYSHFDGMYFGGQDKSWARKTWESVVRTELPGYEHVVHIDLHTGLGKPGAVQLLTNAPPWSVEYKTIASVWPLEDVQSMTTGGAVSAATHGDITDAWSLLPGAPKRVTSVAFEFGTKAPPIKAFLALQADQVLRARRITDVSLILRGKGAMRRAFAPKDNTWENTVVANGTKAYRQALSVLAAA